MFGMFFAEMLWDVFFLQLEFNQDNCQRKEDMVMKEKILVICLMVILPLGVYSCGASSSSTAASAATSLDDIPSVDSSDYDYSRTGSAVTLARGVEDVMRTASGEFSRAACEANFLNNQIISESRQVEILLCYLRAMTTNVSGFTIPSDEYAYYSLTVPSIESGVADPTSSAFSFLMRVGLWESTSGVSELKFDMCETGALSQEVRIQFSDADDSGVCGLSGSVTQSYNSELMGMTIGNSYAIDEDSSKNACEELKAKSTMDSYLSSVSLQAQMDGDMGTGIMTFGADPSTSTNTISGAMAVTQGGNDFSSAIWAKFDTSKGSAKYSASGTMPAMSCSSFLNWIPEDSQAAFATALGLSSVDECTTTPYLCSLDEDPYYQLASDQDNATCTFTDSGVDSYAIAKVSGEITKDSFTKSSSDNDYTATATAATLPSTTDVSIAFSDNWDCTGSFTDLNIIELFISGILAPTILDSCMSLDEAMQEEVERGNNEGMCEQQKTQDNTSNISLK